MLLVAGILFLLIIKIIDLIILPGNFIFEKFKKNKSDTVVDHKSSDIDETTLNFPTEDSEDHHEIDSYKEKDDNL